MSAHTKPVSSANMDSTSAVNASVRRLQISDSSRYFLLDTRSPSELTHSAAPLRHPRTEKEAHRIDYRANGQWNRDGFAHGMEFGLVGWSEKKISYAFGALKLDGGTLDST